MKNLKVYFLFIFLILVISSCGNNVSYHKENLGKELEVLVKRENNINSKSYLVGKTLYLDIDISEDATQENKELDKAFAKVNEALSAMIRVVLSSDADIKFVIVQAYPKNKSVLIRIIESIEDFKSYYYMRISKDDFTSRNVIEIEGPARAAKIISDKRNIDINEFVGRMIVAQVLANARNNPIFSALIANSELKFVSVKNGTLLLSARAEIFSETRHALRLQLKKISLQYLPKYKNSNIKNIKVTGIKNASLIDMKA